jgi:hypothetical protein
MDVEAYFPAAEAAALYEHLPPLPSGMAPTHFGYDERGRAAGCSKGAA